MNDNEINIAIAEACPTVAGVWNDGELRWNYKLRPVPTRFAPVNDLNAMHEAENTLTEQQRTWYSDQLYDIACNHQRLTGKWRYLSLNARQRAEAFLRTLGKWKE